MSLPVACFKLAQDQCDEKWYGEHETNHHGPESNEDKFLKEGDALHQAHDIPETEDLQPGHHAASHHSGRVSPVHICERVGKSGQNLEEPYHDLPVAHQAATALLLGLAKRSSTLVQMWDLLSKDGCSVDSKPPPLLLGALKALDLEFEVQAKPSCWAMRSCSDGDDPSVDVKSSGLITTEEPHKSQDDHTHSKRSFLKALEFRTLTHLTSV
eukprot:CAMPEP_0206246590 /NCGR_PEP_ID=MMETSP0047_2-20121206/19345_1 /ASSEMBLY_ACC=CAM_ASM_000192 /TAXON_ID=195065 /ORGANISM="Chroomonas mesostigmatica_cf, Strain CCMP1168" /LENGTH=211 /DNA_ID=CAMNT_0053672033 /DNA_START=1416 /DNA_END=2051 /DNA_ORIENTATION=+